MRILGALEARYSDEHVPLALVLGALGALSAVRALLPDELLSRAVPVAVPSDASADAQSRPSSPEEFVASLLGAIATHERLCRLFGPRLAGRVANDSGVAGGNEPHRHEGLLR